MLGALVSVGTTGLFGTMGGAIIGVLLGEVLGDPLGATLGPALGGTALGSELGAVLVLGAKLIPEEAVFSFATGRTILLDSTLSTTPPYSL